MTPQGTTSDGFELQFGTNHLGTSALTGLLLDALGMEPVGARRDCSAATSTESGSIDFDGLEETATSPRGAYQRSKFAMLPCRRARPPPAVPPRWSRASSPTRAIPPRTCRARARPASPKAAHGDEAQLMAQSAERGALPTLYAATAPAVRAASTTARTAAASCAAFPGTSRRSRMRTTPQSARNCGRCREELTGVRYG